MTLGGQAGLGDPSAVDRMQKLTEIRGSSFLRNADSESKIQECRPNPSIFLGSEIRIVTARVGDRGQNT